MPLTAVMMREDENDLIVDMHDDDGHVTVRVSSPRNEGARILSQQERHIRAVRMAQNLILNLAECLSDWDGRPPVKAERKR